MKMKAPIRRMFPALLVGALFATAGCGGSATPADAAVVLSAQSREIVAIVDLSGSLTDSERAVQRELLLHLATTLSYGDRLVIQPAHAKGVTNGASPILIEMPGARNPAHPLSKERRALETALRASEQSVQRLFETGAALSTDLIATLHTAANRFTDNHSRPRSLIFFSDMLQCASGLCIEAGRDRVPDGSWVAAQQAAGTVPDLSGLCISVVGADPSTAHGVQVREFWKGYFVAAGAEFSDRRYRHVVAEVRQVLCG